MMDDEQFTQTLVSQLEKRFNFIAKNPLILSCVFLDPRFQLLLDDSEKSIAIEHLTKLYMCYFNETEISLQIVPQATNKLSNLERLLQQKEAAAASIQLTESETSQSTIKHKISNFYGIQRIEMKENILMHWEANKNTSPVLYKLANLTFAVAGTEVKIERNFSTLKFVLNRLRNRLANFELEKILLLKLNKDMNM